MTSIPPADDAAPPKNPLPPSTPAASESSASAAASVGQGLAPQATAGVTGSAAIAESVIAPSSATAVASAPLPTVDATAPAASTPAPILPIIINTENGADPLVRSYLESHRATCAWTTISWTWVLLGVIGCIIGGIIGSHLAGAVRPLSEDSSWLARWLNDHLGNLLGGISGMAVAGLVTSTIGVLVKPKGVPAGQEPLIAMVGTILVYLLFYDYLACLGVLTGALCLIYFLAIAFRFCAVGLGGHRGVRAATVTEPVNGWPLYTILIPLYKERNVARNILLSLQRLDYPRDKMDVKFLLEADDPDTLHALQTAGVPAWAEVVVVPLGQPKTKPRACNHGLARARGDFLVIFDAEDRPDPDQLKQAVLAFNSSDKNVVCLQAQLAYHNYDQNLLTRWFALEYNVWFRRYLGGLVRLGVPIPLGGTSNHFRTGVLHEVGGWDPFNVTEDCDLGVRLYMAGHRTLTLDSVTWEEANSRVGNWIRQRSRWLKGYLITHLVWARRPVLLVRNLGPWGALGFILSVWCVGALAALNLALWLAMGLQGVFILIDLCRGFYLVDLLTHRDYEKDHWSWQMIYSGHGEDPILSTMSQVFFATSACLLLGNIFFVILAILAGRRPGQKGLWWAAILSPMYWVLISIAAWKGIWQLLVKPHFWEKTIHGLDGGDHVVAAPALVSPPPAPPTFVQSEPPPPTRVQEPTPSTLRPQILEDKPAAMDSKPAKPIAEMPESMRLEPEKAPQSPAKVLMSDVPMPDALKLESGEESPPAAPPDQKS